MYDNNILQSRMFLTLNRNGYSHTYYLYRMRTIADNNKKTVFQIRVPWMYCESSIISYPIGLLKRPVGWRTNKYVHNYQVGR